MAVAWDLFFCAIVLQLCSKLCNQFSLVGKAQINGGQQVDRYCFGVGPLQLYQAPLGLFVITFCVEANFHFNVEHQFSKVNQSCCCQCSGHHPGSSM